jgi:hypothetical protein
VFVVGKYFLYKKHELKCIKEAQAKTNTNDMSLNDEQSAP